jgi:hypothetical protein
MTNLPKFTKLPTGQWFDESIPPDSLQIVELRRLQKEAGYESPQALKEQREKRRLQTKKAGEASRDVRAPRGKVRRNIVCLLFLNLESEYRNQRFSAKSIKALHDEYLKLFRREEDNILEAACNCFLAPFSMGMVQGIYDSYQAEQHISPRPNFVEAMSSYILDCRKQKGWDRDLLPTNDWFPAGTTCMNSRFHFWSNFAWTFIACLRPIFGS